MAHTSDSAAKAERAVGEKKAGPAESRRMVGETGVRGGTGQRDRGGTEKIRGHTQCAREQRRARPGGHPKKKQKRKKDRQGTKEGQTEGVGPRGRRGKQGANKGAKVHIVSLRKTPCR